MKLKVFSILLSLMMNTSAFAQFFPAQAYVQVLPGQVSAQVYNPYYEPIICSGQVFGQTFQGPVLNAFFMEQMLPVGQSRYAFVYTNLYNPFVNGWVNIHCRFWRW